MGGGGGAQALMGTCGEGCGPAVSCPEGKRFFTATRLVYAQNGEAVTYAVNEKWCGDATETDSGTEPTCYRVLSAREFRYDAGRQRYLDRSLNACDFQNGIITPLAGGSTWTDYDGDGPYGDYTVTVNPPPAAPTITNLRSFELGMGRVDPWTDGSGGVGQGNSAFYHTDVLGTTRMMTNSGGTSIEGATYTAFGERIDSAQTGGAKRYGFVGAYGYQAHSSSEMPFLHVGARYYDPSSGRFLQRDPIGIAAGTNVFAYVGARPTWSVDPLGLFDRPDGSRPWPKRPGSRPTPRPSPPAPTPSPPNETSDEEDEGIPPGWDPYDTAAVAFW